MRSLTACLRLAVPGIDERTTTPGDELGALLAYFELIAIRPGEWQVAVRAP